MQTTSRMADDIQHQVRYGVHWQCSGIPIPSPILIVCCVLINLSIPLLLLLLLLRHCPTHSCHRNRGLCGVLLVLLHGLHLLSHTLLYRRDMPYMETCVVVHVRSFDFWELDVTSLRGCSRIFPFQIGRSYSTRTRPCPYFLRTPIFKAFTFN